MKTLAPEFRPYTWAPSTEELAHAAGLDPFEIVRFDGNVPAQPHPVARPGTIAGALAEVNAYAHGGYPKLVRAIADYAGVDPEHVVIGPGADDLILLCARAFAGPGDRVAIADEPTYPLYRVAAGLAGATVGDVEPAVTFCCRPNNPTGALAELSDSRPLVVDEAYFEYAGETAAGLIEDGVVVIRTFSKAFGLAGARVGYALADRDTAAELNRRQAPLPVSTLSAALALAALAEPPDVAPVIDERRRVERALIALGLVPLPSRANFLFVPVEDPEETGAALLRSGVVVRVFPGGIRFSIRDREDDDLLLEALARSLDRPPPVAAAGLRRARRLRTSAETTMRVRLALDGGGRVRVATGAGLYDHLLEQLAFHGGLDLVLEGAGDLETGEHHTATDGESPATATRSCRWTTHSPAPLSISAAAHGRNCASRGTQASLRTSCTASPRRDASRSTSRRPVETSITSPRPLSRRSVALSARRCGDRGLGSRRPREFCEAGRDLRLRRRQRPLGGRRLREAGRPARRRCPARRPDRPAGRGLCGERDGELAPARRG
jgi:histidinol-phosphate aminotransferase